MSICEQRWGQKDAFLQRSQIDFNSSKNKQIFGQIYEGFLGELQSAGTLGEYYTPRAITELLVELTDPQLGEIVLDPACGTGGYLVHP